jgi:hypothetical protein
MKRSRVILGLLLISSSALAAETMLFAAPEGTVTKYHSVANLIWNFPKIISTTSDGSKPRSGAAEMYQELLNNSHFDRIDDYSQTIDKTVDNLSKSVTTVGIFTDNTWLPGEEVRSSIASYRSSATYQNDGNIKLSSFNFEAKQGDQDFPAKEQAQEAQDRDANIFRLYGLDLILNKKYITAPANCLGIIRSEIKLTRTYAFLGRDKANGYLFSEYGQSSPFEMVTKLIGGKQFYKMMPATGTGKVSFFSDGRLQHEKYFQITKVVATFITIQGKVTTTSQLEGTISLKRQTDVVE